jgi:hypothetical protein
MELTLKSVSSDCYQKQRDREGEGEENMHSRFILRESGQLWVVYLPETVSKETEHQRLRGQLGRDTASIDDDPTIQILPESLSWQGNAKFKRAIYVDWERVCIWSLVMALDIFCWYGLIRLTEAVLTWVR